LGIAFTGALVAQDSVSISVDAGGDGGTGGDNEVTTVGGAGSAGQACELLDFNSGGCA